MIIYNVTVKVDESIAEDWLHWMQADHIPGIMKTKCFTNYRMARLLETDDSEGPTYAIQYDAESKADYNRYIEIHAEKMRKTFMEKWGDRFIVFRSLMEVV